MLEQVQNQRDYIKTFMETVKPLALQAPEAQILEGMDEFRFMK